MSETIIWKVIEPIIAKEGDCSRHEDRYFAGIPDISYGVRDVNGWIESKFIDDWPRSGPVKFRKFTVKQKNWITNRAMTGGHCSVMLLVGKEIKTREFVMVSGIHAKKLGHISRHEMYQICTWKGNNKQLKANIINILANF